MKIDYIYIDDWNYEMRKCYDILHNGSTFTAKNGRKKQKLKHTHTKQIAAQKNIKLDFDVEEAPWFGAFWEKLVLHVENHQAF